MHISVIIPTYNRANILPMCLDSLVEQNEKAIAEAIIRLLSDKKMMERMGKAAREKIIKDFDNEKRMKKLGQLINKFYKNPIIIT